MSSATEAKPYGQWLLYIHNLIIKWSGKESIFPHLRLVNFGFLFLYFFSPSPSEKKEKKSGMDEVDLRVEIPLPRSVEELLERICKDHNQAQPDVDARRKLAVSGEEVALYNLRLIAASSEVKNLSAFIKYMINKSQSQSPSSSASPPSKNPFLSSHSHSPMRRLSYSLDMVTLRYSPTPPTGGESIVFSLFQIFQFLQRCRLVC